MGHVELMGKDCYTLSVCVIHSCDCINDERKGSLPQSPPSFRVSGSW